MNEIQANQTDLAFLLDELVQMPTVATDLRACQEALQWFKWQLNGLPLHVEDFEHGGHPSLMVTTRRTKRPKLLLLAHIDVVPGKPELFKPRVENGRMYGRGVFDMKFAVACYLKLLIELGPELPKYDLGVMLTSDEEIGGDDGVKALIATDYGADFFVVPDGAPDWGIETEAKGYEELLVECLGVSGHAAHPWTGVNAIDILMAFLEDLRPLFAQEPCGDSSHFHDTMNIGVFQAGEASTVVPDYAKAVVNIRFQSAATCHKFNEALEAIKRRYPTIKTTMLRVNPTVKHQTDHPYHKLYAQLLKKRGIEPSYVRSHGATDVRHLPTNIPALVAKPIGGPQHSDDEWVDLSSVEIFYDVLREFTEEVSRSS